MAEEIHQLVHTLSYGDAISGEVLSLQRFFRSRGAVSEIYAINVHPKYKEVAKKYEELPANFSGKIILHYSLGSPLNALYRTLVKATRCLVYHNLTPSSWFAGINPRIVRDIEEGVKELPELCRITDRLFSDSKFNAHELSKLGFSSEVLELPLDPAKWDIPRNDGIFNLVKSEPGIHVLHVGRLAPNKAIEDIIKVFYFLNRYVTLNSRLWLVGIDTDTELYSFALKRLVHELDLQNHISFTGCLADSEVKALYEASTVYLCMSEHEGFCLPVVEAMQFGLPVIAFESSALTDTVGKGGILVREKKHAEIAELIGRIASDKLLRDTLIKAGHERVTELSISKFQERAASLL